MKPRGFHLTRICQSKRWHMTYFVHGPSEFCHVLTCPKNLLWNFKIDIRTFGKTNFEYCIGIKDFTQTGFFRLSPIDQN